MKLSDFCDGEILVGFFYGELKGSLETIRRRVFNGKVEYDEMVSELYLFLAEDGWRRLRTFDARNGCSLKTWISKVAWRFFLGKKDALAMGTGDSRNESAACPYTVETGRIDVRMAIDAMPNKRYAEAVNLLVLYGCDPKEVALMWHTKVSNVYNIRHRAVRQFRECYVSSAKRVG